MPDEIILTIYTPTYNRGKILSRLYDSLCNQICKKFIWLVVDDGSTDNTKDIIDKWKTDGRIKIDYVYKENGGVHTARDLAYSLIDTELLVGIDSDDICLPDMVESIVNAWSQNEKQNVIGIITPVCAQNGDLLGTPFPKIDYATYQDLTYKYKCVGDHTIVVKSQIMKKIPNAPTFVGEKLVGESYKWIQLPNSPFLLMKRPTVFHFYMEDGYTQNTRRLWFENLKGFAANYNVISKYAIFFRIRLKNALKYCVASFFDGCFNCVKFSCNKGTTLFVYPMALLVYQILKIKWKKYLKW